MEFGTSFRSVLEALQREHIETALIGGLALGAVGVGRATQDMDFLVRKEDAPRLKDLMQALGYALLHESQDVANYVHAVPAAGRVDFLYAHRRYARAMLERAGHHEVFGGTVRIKVIGVEDQIGLKVQSSANDPARYHQDMADIEALMRAHHAGLNEALVREYFELFDRTAEFDALWRRIHAVE
ncbi:MAG: nucleotidyltransferase [Candidatus Omnitrophica bacterium]|nr:nucleotidyltransferase [Candidatus Omnitrophota bacterium]